MAIFRKIKLTNFTTIDNKIFKNKKLSIKAKGLLCTMLSLPDNWNFSESGLAKLSNDSRTSIRTALKELTENGYLTRSQLQDTSSGKFKSVIYEVYEEPLSQNIQGCSETGVRETDVGKCTQLRTNILTTNKLNKKNNDKKIELFDYNWLEESCNESDE